jgi:signal transduction histidine kinase
MTALRRALWMIGAAGLALAAVAVALVAASDHETNKALTLVLGPFVGLSFIGVGLFAWSRRPENRVGALMTAVGFAWFLGALSESNTSTIYTAGILLSSLYAAVIVHLLLAFPSGRLEGRGPRAIVAAGLARAKVAAEPATAARLLDAARDELKRALEELRELARGIHPAVLTERGLLPALEALADRAPVPVALEDVPGERLPAAVEAVAYFVVAESLTNVAKYARAQEAHVRVSRRNGAAVVEVRDDGVGGADAGAGTGLRGLADRLAALDGRLEVHSPPGEGTLVRGIIPCAECG